MYLRHPTPEALRLSLALFDPLQVVRLGGEDGRASILLSHLDAGISGAEMTEHLHWGLSDLHFYARVHTRGRAGVEWPRPGGGC